MEKYIFVPNFYNKMCEELKIGANIIDKPYIDQTSTIKKVYRRVPEF